MAMNQRDKKQKLTRQDLERKVRELEAQLIYRCPFASQSVDKAGVQHLTGSGVIISLTVLGGREIFEPVLIRDGLSAETIVALKADFARSYELATMFQPVKPK